MLGWTRVDDSIDYVESKVEMGIHNVHNIVAWRSKIFYRQIIFLNDLISLD